MRVVHMDMESKLSLRVGKVAAGWCWNILIYGRELYVCDDYSATREEAQAEGLACMRDLLKPTPWECAAGCPGVQVECCHVALCPRCTGVGSYPCAHKEVP